MTGETFGNDGLYGHCTAKRQVCVAQWLDFFQEKVLVQFALPAYLYVRVGYAHKPLFRMLMENLLWPL